MYRENKRDGQTPRKTHQKVNFCLILVLPINCSENKLWMSGASKKYQARDHFLQTKLSKLTCRLQMNRKNKQFDFREELSF